MSPRRTAIDRQHRDPQPPALVSETLAQIEHALGGRAALVAGLSHAPRSADLDYLVGLIGDPRSATVPLATLCTRGGITAGELLEAYKLGEINRAQALAIQKVGAQLADVAADTMRRALPQSSTCRPCQGTGTITPSPSKKVPNPDPIPCTICEGSGTLHVPGDLEHKKLALEMGKLLSKGGGGVAVNVNQQVAMANGTAGGALEALQSATDAILYGDQRPQGDPTPPGVEDPVEGEVVEASEAPQAPADPPEGSLEPDWRGDQPV